MSPSSSAVVEGQALRDLEAQSRADLGRVHLRGQWVPMLASKWVGVVDPLQDAPGGGHRFVASGIWTEHLRLRSTFAGTGDVVLLRSTDFGRRQTVDGKPLWMTFVDVEFSSSAQAQAWCVQRFPGRTGASLANVCTPWRLDPARSP